MLVNELCGAIYGILKLMVLNELHTFEFACKGGQLQAAAVVWPGED